MVLWLPPAAPPSLSLSLCCFPLLLPLYAECTLVISSLLHWSFRLLSIKLNPRYWMSFSPSCAHSESLSLDPDGFKHSLHGQKVCWHLKILSVCEHLPFGHGNVSEVMLLGLVHSLCSSSSQGCSAGLRLGQSSAFAISSYDHPWPLPSG